MNEIDRLNLSRAQLSTLQSNIILNNQSTKANVPEINNT